MLDIAILNEDGGVVDYVGLPVEAHWRLIMLARGQKLHEISRMEDYYGDVDYSLSDCGNLLRELSAVADQVEHDEELAGLVQSVARIVRSAVSQGKGVSAVAD